MYFKVWASVCSFVWADGPSDLISTSLKIELSKIPLDLTNYRPKAPHEEIKNLNGGSLRVLLTSEHAGQEIRTELGSYKER